MKKKLIAAVAALALVASVGAGATLAYLTDTTDAVVNTFKIGEVNISLDEADINVTDARTTSGNDYTRVLPGATLTKDPTVYVEANSEACYVFVKLTNASADITVGGNTEKALSYTVNAGWIQYVDEDGAAVAGVYYRTVDSFTASRTSYGVFDGVNVSRNITEQSQLGNITVKAAAVQKTYVDTVQAAYDLVKDNLQ